MLKAGGLRSAAGIVDAHVDRGRIGIAGTGKAGVGVIEHVAGDGHGIVAVGGALAGAGGGQVGVIDGDRSGFRAGSGCRAGQADGHRFRLAVVIERMPGAGKQTAARGDGVAGGGDVEGGGRVTRFADGDIGGAEGSADDHVAQIDRGGRGAIGGGRGDGDLRVVGAIAEDRPRRIRDDRCNGLRLC